MRVFLIYGPIQLVVPVYPSTDSLIMYLYRGIALRLSYNWCHLRRLPLAEIWDFPSPPGDRSSNVLDRKDVDWPG